MLDRRDVLAGLGSVGALGTAELLRPRRILTLKPEGATLEELVPRRIPGFEPADSDDIVLPRTEGSLASRLYGDQLARGYRSLADPSIRIMLLVAYGSTQNDLLQLHRPETCYPAIGFEITRHVPVELGNAAGSIPAVALTAQAGNRIEDIVYWTRLGRSLPRSSREQNWDRFRAALLGYVSDGALIRASAVRTGDQSMEREVSEFLRELATALPKAGRLTLLGR
ncbi:MAG: exosortase C-terminal domain/associated protein EpsI [Novosphingobium sp.]